MNNEAMSSAIPVKTPRENALVAYHHGVPDYPPCLLTDMTIFFANPTMEHYYGLKPGKDAFGVTWVYEPKTGAGIPKPGDYVLKDIADWKEVVKFPDLEAIDWEKQRQIDLNTNFMDIKEVGQGRLPEGQTWLDTNKLGLCMCVIGPFERLHTLMGVDNALVALLEDPESCYEFFGAVADHKIAYYKKIAQYYPCDVIQAHDDYGANDRMLMAPETWRELIKPHLKRMVDAAHECGLIYQHHSCGYIDPILEDLIEIGVDAIDPLQAKNVRVKELKEKYGKQVTFCGGYDTNGVLDKEGTSPEEIKAEYRRVLDLLGPGGSFVAFPFGANYGYAPYYLEEHFSYGMGFYANPANR